MSSTSEAPLAKANYNSPTDLANICGHGGCRANPGEYWVRFNGRDGSIFELFADEIRAITEHFRFTGTPLERLWAVYRWASKNRLDCWLTDTPSHV